jgi:hypothetical protein
MFGGSWDITSRRVIKTLRREVVAATPTPRVVPHRKWMKTPLTTPGAWQGPTPPNDCLPNRRNIKLYHILINGGAALNLISLAAFKKLQILMSKLQPSCPFSVVGPVLVMPHDCISLLVTFGCPRTSTQRAFCLMSWRSTSPLMPL